MKKGIISILSLLFAMSILIIPGPSFACDICLLDSHDQMFIYSNMNVTPVVANAGEDVTVMVDVRNINGSAEETEVQLLINGEIADSRSVSLEAGEETTVTFIISEEEAGTYTIQIGYFLEELEIEDNSLPAPGIIFTLIAFMTITLFLYMKRTKS
ncbi:CARDB domain-containing protein [Methanolobus sp. WCC5]|uniref:CARDB domain-containing protein n=1 Tax=Methanolobus sp. WCC5 TaxID=3125785 RepID=UPI0032541502